MSKVQVGLVVVSILCFSLGVWQISLAALCALIYISKNQPPAKQEHEQTIESLKKENEMLRKELGEQAVRHALDKAESREKNS